jgi:hypothetical protein
MKNKKLNQSETLQLLIVEKEALLKNNENELKQELEETLAGLNVWFKINKGINEVFSSPQNSFGIVSSILGMTSGYVAKKLFTRNAKGFWVNLEGNFLQMLVSNKISGNFGQITSFLSKMFLR